VLCALHAAHLRTIESSGGANAASFLRSNARTLAEAADDTVRGCPAICFGSAAVR
jgi:hypothetical protein